MNTTTLTLGRPGYFSGRTAFDWLFAALVVAGGTYAFRRYGSAMDVYEKAILVGAMPAANKLAPPNRPDNRGTPMATTKFTTVIGRKPRPACRAVNP